MEVKTPYRIEAAHGGQAALLSRLAESSFREAFSGSLPADDLDVYIAGAFNQKRTERDLKDPGTKFFLLSVGDGPPIGYAKVTGEASPVPLPGPAAQALERLYLRQSHVGRGAGKALLEHVIRYVAACGRQAVWLGVWQENRRAIAFYKKQGFVIYGTKRFVMGRTVNDDYLMKKDL